MAEQQRAFLLLVRPGVSAIAAAALVATAFLAPDGRRTLLLEIALLLVATAGIYALAAWRFSPAWVMRVGLVADTGIFAWAAVRLESPFRLALGYVWPIAVAAVALGGAETLVAVGLALVAATAASFATGLVVEPRLLFATELGLALFGGALVAATRPARRAQAVLAERSAQDATALSISERIRASLDLDAVMETTAAELGSSLETIACSLCLPPSQEADAADHHWAATDERGASEAAASLARLALAGTIPVVIDDLDDAQEVAERQRRLLSDAGLVAGLGYPVAWGGRAVAAIGLVSDRPRAWEREAIPLLERLASQVSAAVAQAEAYEQQERTIAALEEFDEQRQQLVAAVSHELRTPVAATLGFLETLLMRPPADESARRRFLHEATAGARRLARLVDDLLVLTRTERRTLPLVRERVEPTKLLEDALTGLIVPAGREVTFRSEGDCAIDGDLDRLLQVLSNLLSNAIVHGQGEICVACRGIGNRVLIEVADDGPGIPDAQAEQLFVPFARFGQGEGSGLGLAISRSLVEAHGGTLAYRPPGAGRRHAFVLELPAAAGPDRAHAAPAAAR